MSKNSKSTAGTPQGSRARKTSPRGGPTPVAASISQGKSSRTKNGFRDGHGRPKTSTTDFIFYTNPVLTLVCVPPDSPVLFSLEDTADLTGVHPDLLLYYWRSGLIEGRRGEPETGLFFDENALNEIRRIEHYRQHLGVGRRALPLICELQRTSARQKIELHFLRYP